MVLPFLRFDIKCIYRNVTVSRSAPRKRLLDWSLRQISSSACLSQSQFFIKRSTISSSGMHICPSGFHQAVLGLGTFIKRWITLSFEKSSPLPLNNFRGLPPGYSRLPVMAINETANGQGVVSRAASLHTCVCVCLSPIVASQSPDSTSSSGQLPAYVVRAVRHPPRPQG